MQRFLSTSRIALALTTVVALFSGQHLPSAQAAASPHWQVLAPRRAQPLFYAASGLAVDASHNIYVADPAQSRIKKLSPRGTVLATWGTDAAGPLHMQPQSVAVDSAGHVYVLAGDVIKLSASGTVIARWPVSRADGIAVGGSGNVFVLSSQPTGQPASNAVIQKFSPAGALLATWQTPPVAADVVEPNGIVVDRRGDVIVSVATQDTTGKIGPAITSSIFTLRPSGVLLRTLIPHQFSFGAVEGVGATGNMFMVVPTSNGSSIVKVSPRGKQVARWTSFAAQSKHPNLTMTLDARGNVFVAAVPSSVDVPAWSSSGMITVLDTSGKRIAQIGHTPPASSLPLGFGLAVGPMGTVFAGDAVANSHVLLAISPSGTSVRMLGVRSSGPGVHLNADSVAVDTRGNLYVADSIAGQISRFSNAGVRQASWRVAPLPSQLLSGLAVDRNGAMYTLLNNQVVKLSSAGKVVARFGGPGSGPAQFEGPHGLTLDAHGDIYVADTFNDRVEELSPSGAFIAQWGGAGQIDRPPSVAVDAQGHVYALDSTASEIMEWAKSGSLIATMGRSGVLPGQFSQPTDLAIDAHGVLYVNDNGNDRVQKLSR